MLKKSKKYTKTLALVRGDKSDEAVLKIAHSLTDSKTGTVTVLYIAVVSRTLPLDAECVEASKGDEALNNAEKYLSKEFKRVIKTELVQSRKLEVGLVQQAEEFGSELVILGYVNGSKFVGEEGLQYINKNINGNVLMWLDNDQ